MLGCVCLQRMQFNGSLMLELLELWWSTCSIGCLQESNSVWLVAHFHTINKLLPWMCSVTCFHSLVDVMFNCAFKCCSLGASFHSFLWHFVTLCLILLTCNSWLIMSLHMQFILLFCQNDQLLKKGNGENIECILHLLILTLPICHSRVCSIKTFYDKLTKHIIKIYIFNLNCSVTRSRISSWRWWWSELLWLSS